MKVILLKDVKGSGKAGAVLEVAVIDMQGIVVENVDKGMEWSSISVRIPLGAVCRAFPVTDFPCLPRE